MKKTLGLFSLIAMIASSSAMAETYRCANFVVTSDADSGVLLNGVKMRSVGNDLYELGDYRFQFENNYNSQHEVVTEAILSNGERSVVCR